MCHPDTTHDLTPGLPVDDVDLAVIVVDGSMPATLYLPRGEDPRADVLIAHDVFGVSAFYRRLAAAIAGEGFAVILPDLFFRQGPISEPTTQLARERRFRFDETQALDDLEAAIAQVRETSGSEGLVGTVGFCMGGTFVLDLAARRTDLATVCFYGFPAPDINMGVRPVPTPLDVVSEMTGPILGFWGDQDTGVGIENVRALDEAMSEHEVDHELVIYSGVGHGFMARAETDPANQAAFDDAWSRMIRFFDERLRPVGIQA